MTGIPRSELEQIGDRLEQAEAILAYEGALPRRLSAVRSMLSQYNSGALPTSSMRKRWTEILETMLKLDAKFASAAEAAELLQRIKDLRKAVRAHEGIVGH